MLEQLTALMLIGATAGISDTLVPPPVFEKHSYQDAEGKTLQYQLLKPIGYEPESPDSYPLVLHLHGAGARGSDNSLPKKHISPLIADPANRANHPAFVIVPQCPKEQKWVDTDWTALKHDRKEKPAESMRLVLELLDQIPKDYPIDENRIYVTGLSMGGFGAWEIASRAPDKFAAIVPVCGGGDVKTAELLKDLPIWAFHGDKDRVVKPSRSRDMVEAIRAAGGKKIHYTEYEGVGHDSWKPAFKDPKLVEWLFEQRRDK